MLGEAFDHVSCSFGASQYGCGHKSVLLIFDAEVTLGERNRWGVVLPPGSPRLELEEERIDRSGDAPVGGLDISSRRCAVNRQVDENQIVSV